MARLLATVTATTVMVIAAVPRGALAQNPCVVSAGGLTFYLGRAFNGEYALPPAQRGAAMEKPFAVQVHTPADLCARAGLARIHTHSATPLSPWTQRSSRY